jgi:membrane fusion protein, heavy metal efflux system
MSGRLKMEGRAPNVRRAGIVVLLLALKAAGCASADAESGANTHADEGSSAHPMQAAEADTWAAVLSRIRTEVPVIATEFATVTLPARVELPDGARADLGPALEGRLVSWSRQVGDRVESGDVLATLVSPRMSDLQAQRVEAQRRVQSQRELERQVSEQVTAGLRTIGELQQVRSTLSESEATLASVDSLLRSTREFAGDEGAAAQWEWHAPSSGVVSRVHCATGSMVTPGQTCVSVVDADRAVVRLDVPQRLVGEMRPETPLDWFPEGVQEPQRLQLVRCAIEGNASNRTRTCDFASAQGGGALSIGASGRGVIVSQAGAAAWQIPQTAVTMLEGEQVVFQVAEGAESPEVTAVSIQGYRDEYVVVEASGLSESSPVVVQGTFLVKSWLLMNATGGEAGHDHH